MRSGTGHQASDFREYRRHLKALRKYVGALEKNGDNGIDIKPLKELLDKHTLPKKATPTKGGRGVIKPTRPQVLQLYANTIDRISSIKKELTASDDPHRKAYLKKSLKIIQRAADGHEKALFGEINKKSPIHPFYAFFF